MDEAYIAGKVAFWERRDIPMEQRIRRVVDAATPFIEASKLRATADSGLSIAHGDRDDDARWRAWLRGEAERVERGVPEPTEAPKPERRKQLTVEYLSGQTRYYQLDPERGWRKAICGCCLSLNEEAGGRTMIPLSNVAAYRIEQGEVRDEQ